MIESHLLIWLFYFSTWFWYYCLQLQCIMAASKCYLWLLPHSGHILLLSFFVFVFWFVYCSCPARLIIVCMYQLSGTWINLLDIFVIRLKDYDPSIQLLDAMLLLLLLQIGLERVCMLDPRTNRERWQYTHWRRLLDAMYAWLYFLSVQVKHVFVWYQSDRHVYEIGV